MRNSRPQAGTTLVELMVVLSIMTLALLIGAPRMSGYVQGQKLARAADGLSSSMDLARQRAVAEHHPYRVVLNDPEDDQYWFHSDDNGNDALDTDETRYGPFTLPRGIVFTDVDLLGDGQLIFLSSGMLRSGEGGTVTLTDARGLTRTLEVYASGLVTLQ